jgi:hypothetical protein
MARPTDSTGKIQWFEWALLLAALAVISIIASLW